MYYPFFWYFLLALLGSRFDSIFLSLWKLYYRYMTSDGANSSDRVRRLLSLYAVARLKSVLLDSHSPTYAHGSFL